MAIGASELVVTRRGTRRCAHGVTRVALVGRRWTIKFPRLSTHCGIRGWLANQSEWRQRRLPGVNGPLLTLAHVLVLYRTADEVHHFFGTLEQEQEWPGPWHGLTGDDSKPQNWGLFGDEWRLLDFDECHDQRLGLINRVYWWNRDRVGRKWVALARAQEGAESLTRDSSELV